MSLLHINYDLWIMEYGIWKEENKSSEGRREGDEGVCGRQQCVMFAVIFALALFYRIRCLKERREKKEEESIEKDETPFREYEVYHHITNSLPLLIREPKWDAINFPRIDDNRNIKNTNYHCRHKGLRTLDSRLCVCELDGSGGSDVQWVSHYCLVLRILRTV